MAQSWTKDAQCKKVFLLTEDEISALPDQLPDTIAIANIAKVHQLFFPEKTDNQAGEAAMAICCECPVQLQCLKDSFNQSPGIWGGTSGRTRRRVRRMRKIYNLSGKFVSQEEEDEI